MESAREQPAWVVVSTRASHGKVAALEGKGCRVLQLEILDLKVLFKVLAEEGIQNLLIEGGSAVHASALEAGLVDEVWAFVAPRLVGGGKAKTPVGGKGVAKMAEAVSLMDVEMEQIGPDMLIRGRIRSSRE